MLAQLRASAGTQAVQRRGTQATVAAATALAATGALAAPDIKARLARLDQKATTAQQATANENATVAPRASQPGSTGGTANSSGSGHGAGQPPSDSRSGGPPSGPRLRDAFNSAAKKTTTSNVATVSEPVKAKLSSLAIAGGQSAKPSRASAQSSATAAKLRVELALKSFGILSLDGKLTRRAIEEATPVRLAEPIGNPSIIKALTANGSSIGDWKKFKTESIRSPDGGSIQVHFYKNIKTSEIDYGTSDFKVKGHPQQYS